MNPTQRRSLVAERGPAPEEFDPLFLALSPDPVDGFDACLDLPNLPWR